MEEYNTSVLHNRFVENKYSNCHHAAAEFTRDKLGLSGKSF